MLERLRGRRPNARVAVLIVVAVAIADIGTGVVAIVTEPALEGPGTVGLAQTVAEFSGAVVGFALLVAAWGMTRGYRPAYVAAAVLVALSAVHGVVHSRALSVPLVILSIAGLVVLVLTSPRFTRSSSVTDTQIGAVLAIVGVCSYGTAGAYALQGEFEGVDTVLDALYFTLVTASTVGYGDVHATGGGARLFVLSLVVLGPTAVAAAIGSVAEPELEARLSGPRREPRADGGSHGVPDRVVVLGCTPTVVPTLPGLVGRVPIVVVTDDQRGATWLESRGFCVHRGDPTAEETIREVGLESGDAVLIATGDGFRTAQATLAARTVEQAARTVALATGDTTGTLEQAEPDVVVDPWVLVGRETVSAVLEGE